MISDSLNHLERYTWQNEDIRTGFEFIKKCAWNIPIGKYEISNGIFAIVSEYMTRVEDPEVYEVHPHTIDIQIPLIGVESILYCPIEKLHQTGKFIEENDVLSYEGNPDASQIIIGNEVFAIFFKNEPHHPGLAYNKSSMQIKKLTVKIKN